MKKWIVVLTCLLAIYAVPATAQRRYTLSGYVKDSLTGENLIGASVSVDGKAALSTNSYGFYSLTLPEGNYEISISFTGYQLLHFSVALVSNINGNRLLAPRIAANEEVIVYAKRKDANVRNAQMGKIDLSMSQVKSLPVLMGEVDILKALQLLPGVRNAGEGNAGFYVRGGGPDQNLIMLDDAVVYNSGHLFGFFSVFNSDAIKNVSLIKGGMPAQYGGRLSSVLDVAMKDGNMKKMEVDGGIGLIASRLSIQGPIKKDKASFMISARRTYIDALVKPFVPSSSAFHGSGYYFYDLNTKVNYKFSDKDRLYLSGYFGRDVFDFNNTQRSFKANIPWGNATATIRWNHLFHPKLFANTTLVFNNYNFAFNAVQNSLAFGVSSGIRDLTAKYDLDYYPAAAHKMKAGVSFTNHVFKPNLVSGRSDSTDFTPDNAQKKYANELAAYLQDDWEVSDKLQISGGIRFSRFTQIGPYTNYTRDADGNKTDSMVYSRGSKVRAYGGVEPRLTFRYSLHDAASIKASITRNIQYIHLVSNAGSTLPTDLWVPSTLRVQPQMSWQYAAGYFQNFKENTYEASVELYYKQMQNQIEYREGYTPSLKDPEEEFVFGKGWSYGAEFFVRRNTGKLTGWIGYTLSWTWRQFPDLNNGEKYRARYDRRHDLSVVASYDLNKKWKLSAVFVYGTGNATSLPERFYLVDGVLTQEYSRINQYRMPAYHRADLAATYTPTPKKPRKIKSSWVFSVYNVYSRLNPYFIYYNQTGSAYDGSLKVEARQVSLFPILPSVTWNFKW
ncbi:MAG: TonB-dependent receptor [Bacteroidetes bacterium]|nr:TonB-dependent receptor [Bacteroidota bacterium]